MLWVIPCKYDPVVVDCVASIREYHPDDPICIVDSCSDDLTYLADLEPDHVLFDNPNYAWGAFARAWSELDSERWAFVHDSFQLNKPITTTGSVTAVEWLWFTGDGMVDPIMSKFMADQEARMGIVRPHEWPLLFGPMMFTDTATLEDIDRLGGFDIWPTNRHEANGMERVGGIMLDHLGYDTTCQLDESSYTKLFRDRP